MKRLGLTLRALFFGFTSTQREEVYIQSRVEIQNNPNFVEAYMYCFQHKEYAIREQLWFSPLGKVDSLLTGTGIFYYRAPKEKQLPLYEDKYLNYHILLDIVSHRIIDGKDTITDFKQKEGKLYYEDKKKGSFFIYELAIK